MEPHVEGERAGGETPERRTASSPGKDSGAGPASGSDESSPTGSVGPTSDPGESGLEHSITVVLVNRYGLHMRPAKHVMELAHGFPCDIDLVAKGQEVDAKSILGIIGLGAECGDEVTIRARGPSATEAAEAVGKLLSSLPELHGEPRDIP